jgi:hypothetical protein
MSTSFRGGLCRSDPRFALHSSIFLATPTTQHAQSTHHQSASLSRRTSQGCSKAYSQRNRCVPTHINFSEPPETITLGEMAKIVQFKLKPGSKMTQDNEDKILAHRPTPTPAWIDLSTKACPSWALIYRKAAGEKVRNPRATYETSANHSPSSSSSKVYG